MTRFKILQTRAANSATEKSLAISAPVLSPSTHTGRSQSSSDAHSQTRGEKAAEAVSGPVYHHSLQVCGLQRCVRAASRIGGQCGRVEPSQAVSVRQLRKEEAQKSTPDRVSCRAAHHIHTQRMRMRPANEAWLSRLSQTVADGRMG